MTFITAIDMSARLSPAAHLNPLRFQANGILRSTSKYDASGVPYMAGIRPTPRK